MMVSFNARGVIDVTPETRGKSGRVSGQSIGKRIRERDGKVVATSRITPVELG